MKEKKNAGRVFAQETYNGLIITLTDAAGIVIQCINPRMLGFRNENVKSDEATKKVAEEAAKIAKKKQIEVVKVSCRCDGNQGDVIAGAFKKVGIEVK